MTPEEVRKGFRAGMKSGKIAPVVCCSALTGVGIAALMDMMVAYTNSPKDTVAVGVDPKSGESQACVQQR